jgi:hypothetical protein
MRYSWKRKIITLFFIFLFLASMLTAVILMYRP